jgi:single-strand DNA-binding protein
MTDICAVTLIGRLTRDGEIKQANGSPFVNFSVAVNGRNEKVSFLDVVHFGKAAESLAQYLTKGKQVAVTGNLSVETWETQAGSKRTSVKVYASAVQLLGGGAKRDSGGYPEDWN